MIIIHKKILAIVAVLVFFTISGCQKEEPKPTVNLVSPNVVFETEKMKQVSKACPEANELIKQEDTWMTKEGDWKCYTPSSSSKILNFIGAQWVGVRVGKIICLYQTNEAVAFPLALEKVHTETVVEPKGDGWGALDKNRRFCKSANTVDCSYPVVSQPEATDVYEEIQYNPRPRQND